MPRGPDPMPTPLGLAVSARILKMCGLRGRSALAAKAGIDRRHFSRLVNGERSWHLAELERVCDALQIGIVELIKQASDEARLSQAHYEKAAEDRDATDESDYESS